MNAKKKIRLEERLADFTDQLMDGEMPADGRASVPDQAFEELRETVARARRGFQARQPDPTLRNRIRARLAAEWRKSGPQVQTEKKGWILPEKKKQLFVLRLTMVMAALAVLAGFVAPKVDGVLSGASQNKGAALIIVGVVLVILVLVLFWSPRKP